MKIIADRDIPFVVDLFSRLGEVIPVAGALITPKLVRDADALIVRTVTRVDASLLGGSSVRFVATATSGTDHVDPSCLRHNDIGFASAPGCSARSVAEYVLSVLFTLRRERDLRFEDKRVAVIGCGHIGATVCSFLHQLDIEVIAIDPPLREQTGEGRFRDPEAAGQADIITLHVPLTTTGRWPTRGLVDREFLARVRRDAVIINSSRGGVVDEPALLEFCAANRQAVLALDVWAREPDIDCALLQRCAIGTPHIAGYSGNSRFGATAAVFRSACRHFGVDPEAALAAAGPAAARRALALNSGGSRMDMIEAAVLGSYDVRPDSDALAGIGRLAPERRAARFTALRSAYPLRGEFPDLDIQLRSPAQDPDGVLAALGFSVTTTAGG